MGDKMEHSDSSGTDLQQLLGNWSAQAKQIYEDPRVTKLMNSRMGLYLSSHPVLGLTALLFSTMALLPVGLFLTFAAVTIVMSAIGFVCFEVFLLFVGGVTLLSVLVGIAFFSVVASFITSVLYFIMSSALNRYYIKQGKRQEQQSEDETSGLKKM